MPPSPRLTGLLAVAVFLLVLASLAGPALLGQLQIVWRAELPGDCQATVVAAGGLGGGMALPASWDGQSTLVLIGRNASGETVLHELGHADQLCDRGVAAVVAAWALDTPAHEADATARGSRLVCVAPGFDDE